MQQEAQSPAQCTLRVPQLESSSAKKDLGCPGGHQIEHKTTSHFRVVIIPLCSAPVGTSEVLSPVLGSPIQEGIEVLEYIQQKPIRVDSNIRHVRGMGKLGLFSLENAQGFSSTCINA